MKLSIFLTNYCLFFFHNLKIRNLKKIFYTSSNSINVDYVRQKTNDLCLILSSAPMTVISFSSNIISTVYFD